MDDLRERVEAVERALTDGDGDLPALAEGAATAERVEQLETDIADLEREIRELQAATQALRGYVGNVRSVNERVEQRAETALSKVERLEGDGQPPDDRRSGDRPPTHDPDHEVTTSHDAATCGACGQRPDRDSDPRPDRGPSSDPDRPAARNPEQYPGSRSNAEAASYDRPSLDGFDPDTDPDVPDPSTDLDEPLTNGDRAVDATVLSKIRDLV